MNTKRLIFCTNSSLYSSLILDAILSSKPYQNSQIQIVGVFLSERVRTKDGDFFSDIRRIITTSGFSYAIYLALGTLFFDLCRFSGFRPTVQKICNEQNIELFKSKDVNSSIAQTWLKQKNPDVLLSGFFNQKLSEEVLSIPSIAAVNLHPALLPKYKGVDPVFFYFLNEESKLGVTLHAMDATYDTGAILSSSMMNISKRKSIFWHNLELFKLGANLFLDWVTVAKKQEIHKSDSKIKSLESEHYDSWPNSSMVKAVKTPLFKISDFFDQAKY